MTREASSLRKSRPEFLNRTKGERQTASLAELLTYKRSLFSLLNAVGDYAKLLLEEASNKTNQLFPSNGIGFKNTMAMSRRGLGPSESKLAISKTTGREGSPGCSTLN